MMPPYFVGSEMQFGQFLLIALVAATAVASAGSAKSLSADDGPAEVPPASYTANQYVDSRGCVYVRAGYAGQVTWVPRVTRDRKVLCGFKPSLPVAKAGEPEPRVAAKPAPAVAVETPAAPAAKPAAPVSAPQTATARAENPAREAAPARRVAKTGTPRRVVVAPAPAASAPVKVTVTAPRRVVQPAPVKIPAGYEPAWKDDRLNPMRGKGTAEGKAQMDMVWTETVPRRLVERPAARGVTTRLAHAQYRTGRASTKGAPQAQRAASHRYVQVGMFGMPANAQSAKARLRALGLPVAVARTRSKGREVQIVFAGPFPSQAQLKSALGAVRKAGYGDAFLRE